MSEIDFAYQTAKANGEKYYFNGKPCVHGHISERLTSQRACVVCMNKWLKRYYAQKAIQRREEGRRDQSVRKSAIAKGEKYYFTGRPCKHGHIVKRQTSDSKCTKCCLRINQERYSGPKGDYYRAQTRAREKRLRQATPRWANKRALAQMYLSCPDGYHVDHVIPINHAKVCGLHVSENMRHLHAKDNLRKSNKFVPYAEIVTPTCIITYAV